MRPSNEDVLPAGGLGLRSNLEVEIWLPEWLIKYLIFLFGGSTHNKFTLHTYHH